jgi:hypothetical protein
MSEYIIKIYIMIIKMNQTIVTRHTCGVAVIENSDPQARTGRELKVGILHIIDTHNRQY